MRGVVLLLIVASAVMRPSSAGPPYDPDEALRHFRLDPGFRIELAVSEPDIQSPVAMEIDELSGRRLTGRP